MADYKWFDIEDIQAKSQREFAEFFYKKMLSDCLSKEDLSQPPKIEILNYVKLGDTKEYREWFEGIINKDYNPNKISDYKKWEEKKKKADMG